MVKFFVSLLLWASLRADHRLWRSTSRTTWTRMFVVLRMLVSWVVAKISANSGRLESQCRASGCRRVNRPACNNNKPRCMVVAWTTTYTHIWIHPSGFPDSMIKVHWIHLIWIVQRLDKLAYLLLLKSMVVEVGCVTMTCEVFDGSQLFVWVESLVDVESFSNMLWSVVGVNDVVPSRNSFFFCSSINWLRALMDKPLFLLAIRHRK